MHSLESTIADRYYFTINELMNGFALVVGRERAAQIAIAWAEHFASCLDGTQVIALPESFGVRPLAPRRKTCGEDAQYTGELETLHGRRLINFSPGTLVLIAAANPAARKRFDQYRVPYAFRTIDNPVELQRYIDFLRNP